MSLWPISITTHHLRRLDMSWNHTLTCTSEAQIKPTSNGFNLIHLGNYSNTYVVLHLFAVFRVSISVLCSPPGRIKSDRLRIAAAVGEPMRAHLSQTLHGSVAHPTPKQLHLCVLEIGWNNFASCFWYHSSNSTQPNSETTHILACRFEMTTTHFRC